MKEYVAYQGKNYIIEWFYSDKGKSQALAYYRSLSPADRRKVLRLFQLMGETGQIRNKTMFRNEGDKIYAFKPFHGGHNRIAFYPFSLKARKLS